jgi:RNA polymerase sigma-70 factor (ECF subfamily)
VSARDARFEALYRATRSDVLGYLLRRTPQREDAADLLADVYLTAWRRIDDVPPGADARLWLFGTARRTLANSYRADAAHRNLADRLRLELRASDIGRAGLDLTDANTAALHDALADLEPDARELLTLTAWEQLTAREIAQITGDAPGTVRVQLHRARAQLRGKLARLGISVARRGDVVETEAGFHHEMEAAASGLLDADRRMLLVEPALQQE